MAKGIDSSLFAKVKARSDSAIEKAESVISATTADAMAIASETKAGEALADAQAKLAEINLDMADLGIPNPANLADLMPAPLANLQDKMKGIAGAMGDPSALLGQIDLLKQQMPDIDIGAQLTTLGMDGTAVLSALDKVNLGAASDLTGKGQALLGSAKSAALAKVTGLLPSIGDVASIDIENLIPNFEIGADGFMKKLGNPTEFLFESIEGLDLSEMKLDIDTEKLTPDKKMAFSGVAKTNVKIQDQGKNEGAIGARKKRDNASRELQLEKDAFSTEHDDFFGPMFSTELYEKALAPNGSHYGWRLYQRYAKKSIELEYQHELFVAGVRETDVEKLEVAGWTLQSFVDRGRHFGAKTNAAMFAKIEALPFIEIVGKKA
jgi:hypothetical protein